MILIDKSTSSTIDIRLSTYCTYMCAFISFAAFEWKTGKWSKCRLNNRQIQQHCTKITSSISSSSATTDNSLHADKKLNPNPLLIGYKIRKVYCTSTSISKAQQQHIGGGKSQDIVSNSDIDKTFYINHERGDPISVSSKRQKIGKKQRQYNISDPKLTSSSVFVTSNKFCDKQIRPHSRTVCTTHCIYRGNRTHQHHSRYHLSPRDKEDTISQTRNNVLAVVEINARIMNLCQAFEWSEWSKCNLLSRRDDSNYINYSSNDIFFDTKESPKCDRKVMGVQYRKRKENLETKQSNFVNQKCLSEYEERTCSVFKCHKKSTKEKRKKGESYVNYNTANWNSTKDHKRRSVSNTNAAWSRPRLALLLTNTFGQKNKNRHRKKLFQRRRGNDEVSHHYTPLPSLQLPISSKTTQFHQSLPVPFLPKPEKITSTFIPFLHVGPWSNCKNENSNNKRNFQNQYENKRSFNLTTSAKVISNENQIFRNIMNKKHKRRRGKGENQKKQLRGKREEGLFIGLNKLKSRNTWAPELPSDIEISFVASSVPEPQTGIQRRTVECRGQDGERLPFR